MDLEVLYVRGCPNTALLSERLAAVLTAAEHAGIAWHAVAGQAEAELTGMRGSPTLLVGGTDPFAGPGESPAVSCRLYREPGRTAEGAPSIQALRQVLRSAPAPGSITLAGMNRGKCQHAVEGAASAVLGVSSDFRHRADPLPLPGADGADPGTGSAHGSL